MLILNLTRESTSSIGRSSASRCMKEGHIILNHHKWDRQNFPRIGNFIYLGFIYLTYKSLFLHLYIMRAQSHVEENESAVPGRKNRGIEEHDSTNEIFALDLCDYFIG